MKNCKKELIKIAKELQAAFGRRLNKVQNRRYRDDLVKQYARDSKKWKQVEIKDDVNVEAYTFDDYVYVDYTGEEHSPTNLYIIWAGRADKYTTNRFDDKSKRDFYFKKVLDGIVSDEKRKKDRRDEARKERNEFKHDFKVGDFLYASWGYDQTNIDFYKVVGVSEKSIKIKSCWAKVVKSNKYTDYLVPSNSTSGPVMNKRVSPYNRVRITSFASARKWDGKPLEQTSSYYRH